MKRNYLVQTVNSAEVEKPCPLVCLSCLTTLQVLPTNTHCLSHCPWDSHPCEGQCKSRLQTLHFLLGSQTQCQCTDPNPWALGWCQVRCVEFFEVLVLFCSIILENMFKYRSGLNSFIRSTLDMFWFSYNINIWVLFSSRYYALVQVWLLVMVTWFMSLH